MIANTIKPCPVCGESKRLSIRYRGEAYIHCDKCGFCGPEDDVMGVRWNAMARHGDELRSMRDDLDRRRKGLVSGESLTTFGQGMRAVLDTLVVEIDRRLNAIAPQPDLATAAQALLAKYDQEPLAGGPFYPVTRASVDALRDALRRHKEKP